MTLYKDSMPYFDKFIHVYVWISEYIVVPLKNLDAQNFLQLPTFGTQFLNPG